jgi:antitoxin (DNA-binding transcriptional repressor) of toxin-antitoxin stability system
VIIGKAGIPIAKLIPFSKKSTERKPGYWRNKVVIRKDFDELPQSLYDDPFDRMLVAQANIEKLTLITHDR